MAEPKHNIGDLYQMQALPLNAKINMTITRVRGWLDHWDDECYISFSGGKDSTVLVDIIHNRMGRTDIPLVFVDTGLEYPEVREFVKSYGDKVVWLKPKMNFRQVIENYGYPFISKETSEAIYYARKTAKEGLNKNYKYGKPIRLLQLEGKMPHKEKGELTNEYSIRFNKSKYLYMLNAPFEVSNRCCQIMKKAPLSTIKGYPITGQMADESIQRRSQWLKYGCNGFEMKKPKSNPMSFWTEQDVLEYIKTYKLPIASVYGEIVEVVGDDNIQGQMRFDDLSEDLWTDKLEQPRLKTTGCDRTGCMFCGFGCHLEKGEGRFERMKRTHPKQYEWIMKPWDEGGLGYKEVIDWLNENGNLNIRY